MSGANYTMKSPREPLAIAIGVVMAIGLMWAASQPAAGKIVASAWHYAAHFGAFYLFAMTWVIGLPRVPTIVTAAGAIGFGALHEAYEMLGHAHGFELKDAIVDGAGAMLGAFSARLIFGRLKR